MSYVHAQALGAGTGVAAFTKWMDEYIKQKNQARRVFGSTVVNEPGRTDIQRPHLSGKAALDILEYWHREGGRVVKTIFKIDWWQGMLLPPDLSAHKLAYMRAYSKFESAYPTFKSVAVLMPDKLIPEPFAVAIWNLIDPLAVASGAIATTPSPSQMAWESVKEAIKELPETLAKVLRPLVPDIGGTLNRWVKWMIYGGVALGALYILRRPPANRSPRRRR